MHEALTPLTFHRYNRPLRGLMIDNQPWFVARDIGLLMGHRNPEHIYHSMDDDQLDSVRLAQAGGEEEVTVISESGVYRALCRFSHPENRSLRRWLTQATTLQPSQQRHGRRFWTDSQCKGFSLGGISAQLPTNGTSPSKPDREISFQMRGMEPIDA